MEEKWWRPYRKVLQECYDPQPFERRDVEPTPEAAAIEAEVQAEAKISTCRALVPYGYDQRQWREAMGRAKTMAWLRLRLRKWHESGQRCTYCRRRTKFRKTSLDHVVPRSCGGTDDESNLVVACVLCNTIKGCRTPEEWAADILAVATAGGAA